MSLSATQIETIARHVYGQFPETKGARPIVQAQAAAKTAGPAGPRFVLTFRGRGQALGGRTIQRIVRVIADDRGKVLKISTSR
jgi:hypothetical protein